MGRRPTLSVRTSTHDGDRSLSARLHNRGPHTRCDTPCTVHLAQMHGGGVAVLVGRALVASTASWLESRRSCCGLEAHDAPEGLLQGTQERSAALSTHVRVQLRALGLGPRHNTACMQQLCNAPRHQMQRLAGRPLQRRCPAWLQCSAQSCPHCCSTPRSCTGTAAQMASYDCFARHTPVCDCCWREAQPLQGGQAAFAQAAGVQECCGVCFAVSCQKHRHLHPCSLSHMCKSQPSFEHISIPKCTDSRQSRDNIFRPAHLCTKVVLCLVKLLSCEQELSKLRSFACIVLQTALRGGHLDLCFDGRSQLTHVRSLMLLHEIHRHPTCTVTRCNVQPASSDLGDGVETCPDRQHQARPQIGSCVDSEVLPAATECER